MVKEFELITENEYKKRYILKEPTIQLLRVEVSENFYFLIYDFLDKKNNIEDISLFIFNKEEKSIFSKKISLDEFSPEENFYKHLIKVGEFDYDKKTGNNLIIVISHNGVKTKFSIPLNNNE